jgi:hypothetical protein
MTQEQIDKRSRLRGAAAEMGVRHKREIQEVQLELASLPSCDHKFPDGATAKKAGFIYDRCRICFEEV